MSQIMDFYGASHPDCAGLAAHLREILPENHKKYDGTWFLYPFLLTSIEKAPGPRKPQDTDLKARHFESLGQVFMRSGTGPDDTYSLFTIGSQVPSHKQFDENNFIIYKKGYLALDSGTRGLSTDYQLRHYYAQTVAHNGVLIHQPGEPFPHYWGLAYDGPEGKINCGGMYKTNGGKCVAFETNDHYTYIAGDATPCYLPEKCALALRQYVFLMPNHFIICDRVVSTDASYRKDWLLHTQNEPAVNGKQFRADHEGGRLFCTTILPRNAILTKVGGPGKEFRACGKNWELAPEVREMIDSKYGGGLLGNWRMEVSPGTPRKEDVFIHLVQVGDTTLAAPDRGTLVEKGDVAGVRVVAGPRTVQVTFAKKGSPAGHIRISEKGKVVLDRDLARNVMPQAGLSGSR
jgi:heparin/heparan-sulfate lyase